MVVAVPWWIVDTALVLVAATVLLLVVWFLVQAWWCMFEDMLAARNLLGRFQRFVQSERAREERDSGRVRYLPKLDLSGGDGDADR